jgi:polyphosphate kinase 2 (PPK2 family)
MAARTRKKVPSLKDADLSAKLQREVYESKLEKLQYTLSRVQQAYLFSGQSAVIVFEGWDAAGKGGAIRRLSAAFDPRSFKVWPIGPPRNYYLSRLHLLRFMERLPPKGAITAFDRAWYGRVLVERVEELIAPARWKAAYREINDFERMITDNGTRLVKLFFHISPEEQLRRFEARLNDPLKRWKLSYDDFRNRGHWDDYVVATEEMFARTSTRNAPWCLIPAEDKKYARVKALTEIAARLSRNVDLRPPSLDEAVLGEAQRLLGLEPEQMNRLRGRTD